MLILALMLVLALFVLAAVGKPHTRIFLPKFTVCSITSSSVNMKVFAPKALPKEERSC